MYYIYILYSGSSALYYVGYTNNYPRRLKEHNEQENFNTFTSKHRPWELKAVFECGYLEKEAVKIERFIKKQKSRTLLEKLSNPEFILTGALAQLVRVPYVRD
jgi:putative endonuclease